MVSSEKKILIDKKFLLLFLTMSMSLSMSMSAK